ncbi:MAG TPA: hypothetical protein GX506_05880 [Firmicutes bacterium]|nr:hypothetical protein [Bacillota bacterium]
MKCGRPSILQAGFRYCRRPSGIVTDHVVAEALCLGKVYKAYVRSGLIAAKRGDNAKQVDCCEAG